MLMARTHQVGAGAEADGGGGVACAEATAGKLPPLSCGGLRRVARSQQEDALRRVDHRDARGLAADRLAHSVRKSSGKGHSFSFPSCVIRKLSSSRKPPPPSQ